jgi:hypothetical protein
LTRIAGRADESLRAKRKCPEGCCYLTAGRHCAFCEIGDLVRQAAQEAESLLVRIRQGRRQQLRRFGGNQ